MFALGVSGSTHDFYCFDSSNNVYNGASFVSWSDGSIHLPMRVFCVPLLKPSVFFWGFQGFLKRPLLIPNPTVQAVEANPAQFPPLGQSFCFTVVSEELVSSCVSGLLFLCCPSTIFWAIISIVVNSVKRTPFGPFPHVLKEIFKLKPSLANPYPSSSVAVEGFDMGITAPRNHRSPRSVKRSLTLAVNNCSPSLSEQAPTTASISGLKSCHRNPRNPSAIADTFIFPGSVSRSGPKGLDYKSPKPLSDGVTFWWCHKNSIQYSPLFLRGVS